MRLKMKIILWLIRKWDFFFVGDIDGNGVVAMSDEGDEYLRGILHAAFLNGQDNVKNLILGAAEDWLKEREVETRNFIERIK